MADFVPVAEVTQEDFVPVEEVKSEPFVPVEEVSTRPPAQPTMRPAIPAPGQVGPQLGAPPLSPVPQAFPGPEQNRLETSKLPAPTAAELEQEAFSPRIDLGRKFPEGTVKRAAENLLKGIPEFLSSPLGILTPAIQATPAGPVMDAVMGYSMLKSGSQKLGEASVTGNHQTLAEGIGEMILGGAAGVHGLKGPIADLKGTPKIEPNAEVAPKLPSLPETAKELEKLPGGPKDAVQERSAEALPLENAPGNRPEVGARVPEPETPALPQVERELGAQPGAETVSPVRDVAEEPFTPVEEVSKEVIPNETQTQEKGKEGLLAQDLPPPSSAGTEVIAGAPTTEAPLPPVEGRGATPETPETISMGPGAASPEEIPTSGNPDIYGVAERVREERAKAGQVGEVKPGEGIAARDSVSRGRELLSQGANPEESLKAFEQSKRLSSDDMAVTRAQGEKLAFEARRIEERFGTDSDEYRAAKQKLTEWDTRTKAMQTEWHKTGQAQQGETDIDTGSFTGLERAYRENTGKDFTPKQATTAKKKAATVKKATEQEAQSKQNLFNYAKQRQKITDAEKAALDAANKTVRDWAAKTADLERKQQVIDAQRKLEIAKINQATEARVKAAVHRVARRNAIKAAKDEIEAVDKRAAQAKRLIEIQAAVDKKAVDAANAVVRRNAIRLAKEASKDLEARADLSTYAWEKVNEYIDKGMDNFDEIRNKVATDMGVPIAKVTAALAKDKRAKFLADDLWRKQQIARQVKQQAKQWLYDTTIPGYLRALNSIPRLMFSAKVGFHGTVALGTHAPMVAFQPRFWANYVRDFGKMYRMVGTLTPKGQARARAYYEMQVQDLLRRPNYIKARRAGLVNDPFVYEDYNSPDTSKYFGKLTTMGNRGYAVLKILRQDMFDQMWNKLPRTAQIPEMAAAIADGINHATGVVQGKAPRGSNIALFAPRLEASRVMWLAVDPIRAAKTFLQWKTASSAEKAFAVNQIKEKAWVAGTMLSALALNQGFLMAQDSKQKINMDDPFKSDFLKFKAAGMDFSYGNAMLSMARLPVRLYKIRSSDGGKLKNLVYPDEDTYTVLGQYARSQMSPFASLATTLWLKADFQNRPLPNSIRTVPKRLQAQGVTPYTWPEFWSEQVLPIPAEEAVREVWKTGLGMSDKQIDSGLKALATISVMAATGARLTDDVPHQAQVPTKPHPSPASAPR